MAEAKPIEPPGKARITVDHVPGHSAAPYSHTFRNMTVMLPTEETKCISTLLDFGYLNVISFRQITGKLLGRIFGSFETVRSRVLCASIFPLVPLPSLWKKTCPQDSPYAQEEEEKCRGKSHT